VADLTGSVTSRVASLTIVPFNSLYLFGHSWTDTDNCSSVWDSTSYWQHRAGNGPIWPEFFSPDVGLAYLPANNFAHCGAESSQVGDQIASFTRPKHPELSLYLVWAGDGEWLFAATPELTGCCTSFIPSTNVDAWNKLL